MIYCIYLGVKGCNFQKLIIYILGSQVIISKNYCKGVEIHMYHALFVETGPFSFMTS